jgi:hypothetical protein
MKFTLVPLNKLSGRKTAIYSVMVGEEEKTLFDYFIAENIENYKEELLKIRKTIQTIATETGARDHFFDKPEGKAGQSVFALYDRPDSKLRLYCFKFNRFILILGGGGFKPKNIRSFQEDSKLTHENYIMRHVSDVLTQAFKDKDIWLSANGMALNGSLTFGEETED